MAAKGAAENAVLPFSTHNVRIRLNIKHSISRWFWLRLQKSDGDVAYRHASERLTFQSSMMRMAMHNEISSVTIYHFRKSRSS